MSPTGPVTWQVFRPFAAEQLGSHIYVRRCAVWERVERHELKRRGRGMAALRPGERPIPSLPAGTDLLPQIKHIVVLMMENHSYDSYLGMLAGRGDGFKLGRDGQPKAANPNADGKMIRGYHPPSTEQADGVPCQSWHASHLQWNGGRMDGFVTSTQEVEPAADETVGMSYWTEADLPFYYGLARTFPLADRWFSSCLGPTFPNRRFLIAGTANGLVDDLPLHLLDYPSAGTILDMLSRHGISWMNYHDLYPMRFLRSVNHLQSIDKFWRAARLGKLPSVSIVDPDFTSCSEENPQDI